jgi:hypothetical protein
MAKHVSLNKPTIRRSDDVGYRKPPKQTRFKRGKSGNPKGRPKGVRNFSTDVLSTLQSPIKVNNGGRARNISTQLATLLVLRDKALRGDLKAADHLLDLATRYNTGQQSPAESELDADDQAILAAYRRELLTEDVSIGPTDPAKMSLKENGR